MADLSPHSRGGVNTLGEETTGRDRAQIILVGAFALAVVFVTLALVMNAAIYTQNLATRSETAGTADAHAFQRATETAAEKSFHYANTVNDSAYTDLEANVTDAMQTYDNVSRVQAARNGHLAEVSRPDTTDGTNITDDTGDLQSATDSDDWTLATGVDRTRRFRVDIDTWNGNGTVDEEFRVVADDVETWYLNVSYDGSEYEIGVNDSGSYTTCATTTTPSISVDFATGTVNGDPCSAMDLEDVSGSYTLQFENGSVASGQYRVIVDVPRVDANGPSREEVLYDMTVDMTYWTPELRYQTTIRVAPGETGG